MPYTLGEAAKHTGLSKPTIQRAIKNGRLSATRNENGSYSIDPAELERVYGPLPVTSNDNGTMKQDETSNDIGGLHRELELLREERERERNQFTSQIDDLRRRLDSEGEERRKLTALLTDQRPQQQQPEQPRKGLRGFLHRLTG
jgi:excisionase family DNA binding protein